MLNVKISSVTVFVFVCMCVHVCVCVKGRCVCVCVCGVEASCTDAPGWENGVAQNSIRKIREEAERIEVVLEKKMKSVRF